MAQTDDISEQAQRMQAALVPVVQVGPDFLAGTLHADDMAHTMVAAVQGYVEDERARQQADGGQPVRLTRHEQELQQVLAEVYGCGSGYLANRCDAACVARTMTQIVAEFGTPAAAH